MTKYTKQQAVSIIVDCAAKYEENLNGYQLLFVLKDKHKHISFLEVNFYPYNFLHLTGIKLVDGTTATDFYERCLNHKLSPEDFSFASDFHLNQLEKLGVINLINLIHKYNDIRYANLT